jgi:hypothetical protein
LPLARIHARARSAKRSPDAEDHNRRASGPPPQTRRPNRWRAVNSGHLIAQVSAGAKFENGVRIE